MPSSPPPAPADTPARPASKKLFPDATHHLFPKVTHIALAHHEDAHAVIDAWWPSPVLNSHTRQHLS